jgi:hypothetical protein
MRHLRMVGLALVAVLATTALVATSASALPEWGQCFVQAKHEGKWANSSCTVKAKVVNTKPTGGFEWRKGTEVVKKHFTGNNVGSGGVLTADLEECQIKVGEITKYLRTTRAKCKEAGGTRSAPTLLAVECESEHNAGDAKGSKEVANVSVKFRGCKLFGSLPCSNGTEPGEIATNTLKGSLGYINKAKKEVGVLLTPAKAKGAFAQFICGGQITTVVGVGNSTEGAYYEPETTGGYDGIISPVTPVNTMTKALTQVYKVNPATDENIPSKFEGKHIDLLETYTFNTENPEITFMWSRAGEEITNVNTPEEEVEIKA